MQSNTIFFLRSLLIISCYLRLHTPCVHLISCFRTKILYALSFPCMLHSAAVYLPSAHHTQSELGSVRFFLFVLRDCKAGIQWSRNILLVGTSLHCYTCALCRQRRHVVMTSVLSRACAKDVMSTSCLSGLSFETPEYMTLISDQLFPPHYVIIRLCICLNNRIAVFSLILWYENAYLEDRTVAELLRWT
jgi:hypothetical protein